MYWKEFIVCWRYLTAAALGLAVGYSLVNYINNIFTPHLLDAFGWRRSQVALVGTAAFLGILTQPIAGRLADSFGVKNIALIGVCSAPMVFAGFGIMTGALWQFFVLTFLQVLIVGGTTSAVIYTRLVAQSFQNARGVAFAIAASASPIAGAILAPFISLIIDNYGWRTGYFVTAGICAVGGVTALMLIPKRADSGQTVALNANRPSTGYAYIFKSRAFRLIITGFILCNLSFTLQTQHLKVVLLDNGVSSATGSSAIALFALSVIFGRLLCGVALDRFPAWLVAAIALGLPGIGLALLASGYSNLAFVLPAVLCLGFALGAETDILAYIVGEYFRIEIFSTVLGLLLGGFALSVALGALFLSYTLELTGDYRIFLTISAVSGAVGSGLFLLLGREPVLGTQDGKDPSLLKKAEVSTKRASEA